MCSILFFYRIKTAEIIDFNGFDTRSWATTRTLSSLVCFACCIALISKIKDFDSSSAISPYGFSSYLSKKKKAYALHILSFWLRKKDYDSLRSLVCFAFSNQSSHRSPSWWLRDLTLRVLILPQQKKKAYALHILSFWLRKKDSNPHRMSQSH